MLLAIRPPFDGVAFHRGILFLKVLDAPSLAGPDVQHFGDTLRIEIFDPSMHGSPLLKALVLIVIGWSIHGEFLYVPLIHDLVVLFGFPTWIDHDETAGST